MQEILLKNKKSEPVQDIIDKMPKKFGFWVSGIVLVLFALLILFGYIIEYPDTVVGSIVINSKYAPVKLIANASGRIQLRVKHSKHEVNESEYIAVIQNPANTEDVIKISNLISRFSVNQPQYEHAYSSFPTNVSLGDINSKYYTFLNALKKVYDYNVGNLYEKQEEGFKSQLNELFQLQNTNTQLKETRNKNMLIYKKMYERDSSLFADKAATELEVDNGRASFLNSKESYQSISSDINNTQQKIDDYQNKLRQLYVQKSDDVSKMKLDILTALDDLKDNINLWEQHYVFKSPMNGTVEFLKFWNNNQYIQSGEDAFTVIPKKDDAIGHVSLPSQGAGKVKVGQTVIIKLDNYPFEEYGYIRGKVNSISYSTNILKANNQTNLDAYLIEVKINNPLRTNYGSVIDCKYELKGTAEIVSNERKLIARFFDNLHSVSSKTSK